MSAMVINTNRRTVLKYAGALSATGLAGCLGGSDGDYPDGTITLIVPYGEGGGTDIYARHFGDLLSNILDVPFQIDNVPGGGGVIGVTEAYNSQPDGYTYLFGVGPGVGMFQYLADPDSVSAEYEEFEPVGVMGAGTHVVAAGPDFEGDYADIVDQYADGELSTIGGQQPGSNVSVSAVLMQDDHGATWEEYVGYDGSAPVGQAVASGEVPVGLSSESALEPFDEEGNLTVVADLSGEGGIATDIPSVVDYGYDDQDFISIVYRLLLGPPGTDEDQREVVEDALAEAVESEETEQWVENTGNDAEFGDQDRVREVWHGRLEEIPEQVDMDAVRELMGVE